jgi:hypothetical protein
LPCDAKVSAAPYGGRCVVSGDKSHPSDGRSAFHEQGVIDNYQFSIINSQLYPSPVSGCAADGENSPFSIPQFSVVSPNMARSYL